MLKAKIKDVLAGHYNCCHGDLLFKKGCRIEAWLIIQSIAVRKVLETVVSLLKLHSDTSSSEFGRDQSSGVCKTFQVPSHELNLKTINLFFAAGNIAKKRKDL